MAEKDQRHEKPDSGYHVVFKYLEGPSKGIMTWTSYDSQEDFEKDQHYIGHEEVVAQGVTEEEALKIIGTNRTEDIVVAQINKGVDAFKTLINK